MIENDEDDMQNRGSILTENTKIYHDDDTYEIDNVVYRADDIILEHKNDPIYLDGVCVGYGNRYTNSCI